MRKIFCFLLGFIILISITACGSSGSGNGSALLGLLGGGDPPGMLTYATTSAVYTLDVPIADNVPSFTGVVTSWSSDPALPNGLEIDPVTGVISGTPTATQPAANYVITASNEFGSMTTTISITVNTNPPSALTYATTSCVYTKNLAIADNIPTYNGSVTSWSVDPALPDGLILGTDGVIAGTPVVEQTATSYTITAGNPHGTTTATISITVNLAAPSALSYATTSCVYTRDLAIAPNVPTVTGTVSDWDVDPALPAGLVLGADGTLSGTPTLEQPAQSYTITASNSGGSTTATISITVNLAAPTGLSYGTTSCVYTKDAAIANNIPTVTGTVASWSVDPALPAGLALNTTTGVISGTPTLEQPAQSYTITASNSGGSTTATISITVNLAAPTALSYGTTSCVYTKDAVIANNIPTVTGTVTSWSVDPALPSGLTLNTSTGVISGTPDTEQTVESYTITASNSGGSTTATIAIIVNLAAPAGLSYSAPAATYTKDEVIADNIPNVTGTVTAWSVDPGLPSGLTLNTTTGVISGTPTATQAAADYTITAANSGGSTTATISIAVTDGSTVTVTGNISAGNFFARNLVTVHRITDGSVVTSAEADMNKNWSFDVEPGAYYLKIYSTNPMMITCNGNGSTLTGVENIYQISQYALTVEADGKTHIRGVVLTDSPSGMQSLMWEPQSGPLPPQPGNPAYLLVSKLVQGSALESTYGAGNTNVYREYTYDTSRRLSSLTEYLGTDNTGTLYSTTTFTYSGEQLDNYVVDNALDDTKDVNWVFTYTSSEICQTSRAGTVPGSGTYKSRLTMSFDGLGRTTGINNEFYITPPGSWFGSLISFVYVGDTTTVTGWPNYNYTYEYTGGYLTRWTSDCLDNSLSDHQITITLNGDNLPSSHDQNNGVSPAFSDYGVATYAYDPTFGLLDGVTYAGTAPGFSYDMSYDAEGKQITSSFDNEGAGDWFQDVQYDVNGNIGRYRYYTGVTTATGTPVLEITYTWQAQ